MLFGMPFCIFLSATRKSPIHWRNISCPTKTYRILLQLAPFLIIGPIAYLSVKTKFVKEHMLEIWLHLAYSVIILVCAVLYFYGTPMLLRCAK